MRLIYPAALLVSASAIGYEILLMRLLSIVQWHHFAYMIISLALFGYAASGTAIALTRRYLEPRFAVAMSTTALAFAVAMLLAFYCAQRVPFNALAILWEPKQFLSLMAIYLIFMVPFFFAASCIGLALAFRRQFVERIYFFDLLGAGAGAIVIIALLFHLSPPNALVLLSVAALAASVLVAATSSGSGRKVLFGLQLSAFAFAALSPPSLLELRMSQFKGLSQTLQVADARVVAVRSNPLGLLTVVESPTVPFRYVPGLSFAASSTPAEQLGVFNDGDDMSVITRFAGDFGSLGYLGETTSAMPYQLLESPRVLILGAGGGAGVLQALYHRAATIDAVELNPAMLELVDAEFGDFSGRLYRHESVETHLREARGFVAASEARWDLIQLSLLDSFASAGSGARGLSESYLYTIEAISTYLEHLTPGGALSITRWLRLPPRDSLKMFATALEALRRSGVTDPGRHLAMIRSWNTVTLLVSRSPLTAAQIDRLRAFARSLSFDTAWYPSMPPGEANRYNRLDGAPLYDAARALQSDRANDFIRSYKFDITPATDDRPYFFHFFKWDILPETLALARQGGAGLIEWGYLVLVATFLQAAGAGLLLILLPLRIWGRPGARRRVPGAYFFLLGLAFLFIEIAFIQRFILFLNHPLYSVAVVLGAFLVFAGVGSAASAGFTAWGRGRGYSPVTLPVVAIATIAVAYLWLLPLAFEQWIGQTDSVKLALSVLLIAPLAFFMGMPFPAGLALVGEDSPEFIPWAWAINGFASVVSATLATLLAIEFGFTLVLVAAILLYALAGILLRHAGTPDPAVRG